MNKMGVITYRTQQTMDLSHFKDRNIVQEKKNGEKEYTVRDM